MGMADTALLKPLFTWRSALASEYGPPSPVTRHVLLTLALHMSEKGDSCFPSIKLLCAETALSNKAVINHLQTAEVLGWISRRERKSDGQGWKRMEYQAAIPPAVKQEIRALQQQEEGGERHTPPVKKAVNVSPKAVNVREEGGERQGNPHIYGSTSESTSREVAPSDQLALGAVEPVNGNAVAYIPIIGGKEYGVSKALLTELETAYPAVDGDATLKEIRAWCLTNPTKRKTVKGVPRFINSWFSREQNRG